MATGHYQFEAIHPFEDGNGRTGRILNLLFLIEQGLLQQPICTTQRSSCVQRRQTASEYLSKLTEIGVLTVRQVGREKLFVHQASELYLALEDRGYKVRPIRNVLTLYRPVVTWAVYNCSGPESQLVAEGLESSPVTVYDRHVWAAVQRQGTK